VADTVVIFRTHSDIEASLVRGLLETHDIPVMISSGLARAVFPVPATELGELRITVPIDHADEALRLIAAYQRPAVPEGPRVVPIRQQFLPLEDRIRYRFRDRGLLEHSLTHRSRAHEDITGGVADNESLEFLGDAVLGFIIAEALFREYPELDEGQKSKIKASLVSATTLALVGEQLDLGPFLLLGRGEEKTGGRKKTALLADATEAIIAAVYLDGGMDAARDLVMREVWCLRTELSQAGTVIALTALTGDFKSALQELLQSQERGLPDYRIVGESGPDHRKVFDVEVWVGGEVVARAEGRSKKEAEQRAAQHALDRLTGTLGKHADEAGTGRDGD
jgi:ribonuclease-3